MLYVIEGWQEKWDGSLVLSGRLAKEEFGLERYVKEFDLCRRRYQWNSGDKGSFGCVRMVNVRYVMKVLWKILRISCCTVKRLQVMRKIIGYD